MKAARTTHDETAGTKSRSPNPEILQQGSISQCQRPDTTGPSLLSRLPDELLIAIFNSVGDSQSLEKLCIATESDARVYETALVLRWKRVTIDDGDLIPAPAAMRRASIIATESLRREVLINHGTLLACTFSSYLPTSNETGAGQIMFKNSSLICGC